MKLFDCCWIEKDSVPKLILFKLAKHPSKSIVLATARQELRLLKLHYSTIEELNLSAFSHYDRRSFDFWTLADFAVEGAPIHFAVKFSDGSYFKKCINFNAAKIPEDVDSAWDFFICVGQAAVKSILRNYYKFVSIYHKKRFELLRRLVLAIHTLSGRISNDWRLVFYVLQNPERIGHLSTEPDIFFSEVLQGIHPKRFYVILLLKESWVEDVGEVSIYQKLKDSQILKMLRRKYPMVVMSRAEGWSFPWYLYARRRSHAQRDINGVLDISPQLLRFTSAELRKGKKLLRKLRVPDGSKFVCLHMREPGFIGSLYRVPDERYSYRDVHAETYRTAVDWLISQGYYVIRMGVPPLPPFSYDSEKFIHYPEIAHSSFADAFLCAHCDLFIGTTSGLYAVADIFRKPILFTNFAPLGHIHSWSTRHLTIPKLAFHNPSRSLLNFREMLTKGFGDVVHGEKVSSAQIEYLPNTSQEILCATQEIVERIRGNWKESPEDWQLQKRFWDLIPIDELNNVKRARVSSDFLRRYRFLLPIDTETKLLEYPVAQSKVQ